ncbi:MAG: tRNA-binding protein [Planctomycetaceae bacterium]|nr:tRNA-binding protein [Planctomycetaceae bacterium]
MIEFDDFTKVEMHVGTVTAAEPNSIARKPAYVLTIDFGPLGVKTSSAQVTEHYSPAELVGLQVVAVTNFPPKQIAGIKSEVLVLASTGNDGTVLLTPTSRVSNGARIA